MNNSYHHGGGLKYMTIQIAGRLKHMPIQITGGLKPMPIQIAGTVMEAESRWWRIVLSSAGKTSFKSWLNQC